MGLISKIFAWFTNAGTSEGTIQEWTLGLVLILILSFLWSTVVRQTLEA